MNAIIPPELLLNQITKQIKIRIFSQIHLLLWDDRSILIPNAIRSFLVRSCSLKIGKCSFFRYVRLLLLYLENLVVQFVVESLPVDEEQQRLARHCFLHCDLLQEPCGTVLVSLAASVFASPPRKIHVPGNNIYVFICLALFCSFFWIKVALCLSENMCKQFYYLCN